MENLVLYAVENGERRPLMSLAAGGKTAQMIFTARMANEMREAEKRGNALPEFKIVHEEREADEGGKFVVHATFTELDGSLNPVGKSVGTLPEIFADKNTPAPAPVDTPATRSAALSV